MKFTLTSLLLIIRPGNVIITGSTVFVGGLIAGESGTIHIWGLVLASISAGLVAAGGNVFNDFYDIAVDLVNRPDRAIPSGRLSRSIAGLWGWVLTGAGLAIGFWVDVSLGIMASGVGVLLWLYNKILKRTYFWGNLSVAVCGGAAFIYGGFAVGKISSSFIPAIFAFLIHLAREIVKDIEDIAGDLTSGAKTIPIVSGTRVALIISAVVLIALALSTPLPYYLGDYSSKYLIIVTITVSLPLLVISTFMIRGLSSAGVKRISSILKIIMITGLVSLYIG